MEDVGMMILSFLPLIITLVVLYVAQWKIFVKAGKPGWASLIPIYSGIVLLDIVGKPTWWIFMFIIPFVNVIFLVWTINMLSKSFGKEEGFTIGLLLLGIVFIPILGFGPAKYHGPYGEVKSDHRSQMNEAILDA